MLLSWLWLLGPGRDVAFALDPATGLHQYNHQAWTRRNGLPVGGINAIAQTRDGYLWFGSSAGLVRFDGVEFKLHDFHSVASLRSSVVTSLAASRAGGVWVGLENNGFGFYDGRSFSFHGERHPETKMLNVCSLAESQDGSLWIGVHGRAAARLKPDQEWEPLQAVDPSTEQPVHFYCIHEGRQGRVWLGTYRKGVYFWRDGVLTEIPDPTLHDVTVRCLAEDAEGSIWVGTQEGLRCYGADLRRREIPDLGMEIRALLVDRHDVLWIGTSGHGLIRQRRGNYDFLPNIRGGAEGDFVQAFAEDHEGSLWVGTREGVVQISDVKFPIQPAAPDPAIQDAVAVGASAGGVWIASSGGIALFNPQTRTYWTPSLPKPYAKRVFEARNGDVYVVNSNRDLVVLSGGKVAAVYPASNMVVGMAEDAQGVVVSVGGELYRASPDYFHPYEFKGPEKPRFDWILNMASGRDGSLWVATVNGIFKVKEGEYRRWGAEEGLSDLGVMSICEDPEGVVWAGLLSGIARLKDDRVRHISRKDGLFDDNIYAIVPDDLGNLWIDSARGIFRASRRDLNDFADGGIPRVKCTVFDGLESVKVVDKISQERVGCKTSDGRIWFPGPRGVVMIDPANVPFNRTPPPVRIARLRANRRDIDLGHAVVPPGEGENGLEFHYDALSFIAPQKTRFRYQLVGHDRDWVEAEGRRMAFYASLPPGRYTFRVIAANADGIWNEEGDSLDLELRPLFSQTIWFRLLCGVVVFGILAGAYLWRIGYLTRQRLALQKSRDLLETEVRHRTAELAEANQTLRQDIEERGRMQAEIDKIHKQLLDQSRQAGMAEVATSVLHNVGNVLNSVNVSATLVADLVRRSKVAKVGKVRELLDQHRSELGPYLTEDAKGRMIPAYLGTLAESLAVEQETVVAELGVLQKNIGHIKDIVAMQQSYAKTSGVVETLPVSDLIEDAIRMNAGSLARHEVGIARDYDGSPVVTVDKNKVLQILVNLIRNAKHACDDAGRAEKLITLRVTADERGVEIAVSDNGVGIPPENLTRIFAHGFTTRKNGHGFGLHSGALAARELGGSLAVRSDGPGKGATFTLMLPLRPASD